MMKQWMTVAFTFMAMAVCSWVIAETPDSGWNPVKLGRNNDDVPLPREPTLSNPCEPAKMTCCACHCEVSLPGWNLVLWLNRLICRETTTSAAPANTPPWNRTLLPSKAKICTTMSGKEVRVRKFPLTGDRVRTRTLSVCKSIA